MHGRHDPKQGTAFGPILWRAELTDQPLQRAQGHGPDLRFKVCANPLGNQVEWPRADTPKPFAPCRLVEAAPDVLDGAVDTAGAGGYFWGHLGTKVFYPATAT